MTPDQWAALVLIVGAPTTILIGILHELRTPVSSLLGEDGGDTGTGQSPP